MAAPKRLEKLLIIIFQSWLEANVKVISAVTYKVYAASTATSVSWNGVTGKPTTFSAFSNYIGYMNPVEAAAKYTLIMRDNIETLEQCEVSFKISDKNRILDSYGKFAGYVLCI